MSASDTIQRIKDLRAKVVSLKKILQGMDQASGVSISIRRGVSRDDDLDPTDATHRQWVTVETAELNLAVAAITAAIQAAETSATYWLVCAQADHRDLGDFLAANTTA